MMSFYFIDDDKNICNILKLIINERGLGVCCGSANNAAEALEDLPSAKPDIVIVDLLMPEMDGISFVKQARKIVPDASYIIPQIFSCLCHIQFYSTNQTVKFGRKRHFSYLPDVAPVR